MDELQLDKLRNEFAKSMALMVAMLLAPAIETQATLNTLIEAERQRLVIDGMSETDASQWLLDSLKKERIKVQQAAQDHARLLGLDIDLDEIDPDSSSH